MTGLTFEMMQAADWALVAFTVLCAFVGLFRGFSGTLGFAVASAAATFSVTPCWDLTEFVTAALWPRRILCFIAILLVFGVVRLVVKKLVRGLLAQPSDAIFGFILGVLVGVGAVFVWAMTGLYTEFSTIATYAASIMK